MKPFVTYEQKMYHVDEDMYYISRKKKKQLEQPYLSAVIDDLSSINLSLDVSTQDLLLEATEALLSLDLEMKYTLTEMPFILLKSESLSSSRIEHMQATYHELYQDDLLKYQKGDVFYINQYMKALKENVLSNRFLSKELLIDMYQMLLDLPNGSIRRVNNWIGKPGSIPHEASYVPPYYEHIDTYMNQLIKFCKRDDIHPLIQASFAHAYFETIHPFEDGNGRVGRMLIMKLLIEKEFLSHVFFPFSLGIIQDEARYIKALETFREGDYQNIIHVILENALIVIPQIKEMLTSIQRLKQTWIEKIHARKDALIWRMLDDLIQQPVVDVSYFKNRYQKNDQAIRNNIDLLMTYDILEIANDKKRNVLYVSKEVLDIYEMLHVNHNLKYKKSIIEGLNTSFSEGISEEDVNW